MKKFKTTIVIPAGRKRYLEILIPNILKQTGWDELHVWKNTLELEDTEYIDQLSNLDNRIKIISPPRLEPYGSNTIGQFFENCTDPETVYIRFDDDVCWIEPGLVEWLADLRWNIKEYFLISPLIINNSIMTYFLQEQSEFLISGYEKIKFDCLDQIGWGNPEFAKDLHYLFLEKLKAKSYHSLKFSFREIKNIRYSINCISWLGEEFKKFNGQIPDKADEEEWLTVTKPKELKKKNLICGQKICSHFSFYTQRKLLDQTDVLEKYKEFLNV